MSSVTELNQEQLAAARASAWKQAGEPLLTLEAVRDWVNQCGLVLFAPLPQLAAPAPSMVEATLGKANAAPTPAESATARSLLARLVGEGMALPLNLLGSGAPGQGGDHPDFVVSAQVFSYVFTMRGDKAWKQPPSTSGAVKVSPLGLRVYEALTERGGMTAMELASELGREVTEAAILRALNELWGQLRVIPLLSQGGGTEAGTLWELTTRRFTRAIKAGANAGQPTALSALVSLYLAQVFAATEEDVATFLSPLTARSRIREVLHALLGARQLDSVAVEGKTLLHIPGTLPEPSAAASAGEEGEPVAAGVEIVAAEARPKKVGTGRIRSFEGERKPGSELRGKPARTVGAGAGRLRAGAGRPGAAGENPGPKVRTWGTRSKGGANGKSDRERRPFQRDGAAARSGFAKPKSFAKPWEEEKTERAARGASTAAPDGFAKFRKPAAEDREALGPREQAGLPPERRTGPKLRTETRPRMETKPRTGPKPRAERGTFDRAAKPGGFAKRPSTSRTAEGGDRPLAKRPYTPRTEGERGSFQPRRYEGRAERGADRGAGPGKKPGGFGAKRPYTPRSSEGGDRPFAKRAYTPKAAQSGERDFAKRAYTPRAAEDGERTLPKRPYKPRAADAGERKFTKAPWVPSGTGEGGAGKRPYKPRGEGGFAGGGARKSFGGKPAGKFGSKPGGSKPGGARPGGGEPGVARPPSRYGPGGGARPAGKFGGKSGGFGGGKRTGAAGGARSGPSGGARPSARKGPRPEARG